MMTQNIGSRSELAAAHELRAAMCSRRRWLREDITTFLYRFSPSSRPWHAGGFRRNRIPPASKALHA